MKLSEVPKRRSNRPVARGSHSKAKNIVSQYIKGSGTTALLKSGTSPLPERGYSYRRMERTEEEIELENRVIEKRIVEKRFVNEEVSSEFKMSGRNNVVYAKCKFYYYYYYFVKMIFKE